MARAQHLAIWMNGLPVGYWERQKGEDLLSYLPQWTTERQGRPLSLSLPFTPDNQVHRGKEIVTTTEDVIRRTERLLPQDFPAEVADSIFNGMRKQCARFG